MLALLIVLVTCVLIIAATYAYTSSRVRSADLAYEALRAAARAGTDTSTVLDQLREYRRDFDSGERGHADETRQLAEKTIGLG